MRSINIIVAIMAIALSVIGADRVSAQNHEERRLVREGYSHFQNREYKQSIEKYNEALKVDPNCLEAKYNRANAFQHAVRENMSRAEKERDTTLTWSASNKMYEELIAEQGLSSEKRAELYRNVGESLMLQENHEAALNAFRESLKLNPDDPETKRNYVLAKRVVDQKRQQRQNDQNNQGGGGGQNDQNQEQEQEQEQEQNDQGGGGNQDENQDENQDQNQDKNDSGGGGNQDKDQDKDQGQGDGDGDGDEEKDSDQEGGPGSGESDGEPEDEQERPSGLSDEQERLLDAVQVEEDKTQGKLNEDKATVYVRGKKNW